MGACLKAITELNVPPNVPQMYPEFSIIGLLFFTNAIILHKTVILANFKLFSKKKTLTFPKIAPKISLKAYIFVYFRLDLYPHH